MYTNIHIYMFIYKRMCLYKPSCIYIYIYIQWYTSDLCINTFLNIKTTVLFFCVWREKLSSGQMWPFVLFILLSFTFLVTLSTPTTPTPTFFLCNWTEHLITNRFLYEHARLSGKSMVTMFWQQPKTWRGDGSGPFVTSGLSLAVNKMTQQTQILE